MEKLISENKSYAAIARMIGRSTKYVKARAKKWNLISLQAKGQLSEDLLSREQLGRMLKSGLSSHRIAEKIGKSQRFVSRRMERWSLKSICPPGPAPTQETKKRRDRGCLNCGGEPYKGAKYCKRKCQTDYAYEQYISKWKRAEVSGNNGYGPFMYVNPKVRRYLFEKYDSKCTRCGWAEVNPHSNRIPLTVEHINGDGTDSREENLDLICPNCHSLTPTYCGLNMGKGRGSRTGVPNLLRVAPNSKKLLRAACEEDESSVK